MAAVLQRMVDADQEPLLLVRDLCAALRPASPRDSDEATRNWRHLLALLEEHPAYRRAAAGTLFACFAEREQRSFYTEAGLLPNTGFFSELRKKVTHKILPEEAAPGNLQHCVRLIFPDSGDVAWLEAIPAEDRAALRQRLPAGRPELAAAADPGVIMHPLPIAIIF